MAINRISAISRRGERRFLGVSGRVNADVFIQFLERLLPNMSRPVYRIVDGRPTPQSGQGKRFLESVSEKLYLFFLPHYSPELNPDELVWNQLKNHGIGHKIISGPDPMKREALGHMHFLQKSPAWLKSFFRPPSVSYAV